VTEIARPSARGASRTTRYSPTRLLALDRCGPFARDRARRCLAKPSFRHAHGAETVRRAHAVHPISDLQIEYSLLSRGIEAEIFPTCRELGIGLTAYGVLSGGLLSGHWSKERAETLGPRDFRASAPRFTGENLERSLALVDALRSLAEEKTATVAQLAIGWTLSRGDDVVRLVGARRRDRLTEALGALDLELTGDDQARIEDTIPADAVAGRALSR
jgi:aryl-alcohol dehydrogenase-like predicted oxidoreductase